MGDACMGFHLFSSYQLFFTAIPIWIWHMEDYVQARDLDIFGQRQIELIPLPCRKRFHFRDNYQHHGRSIMLKSIQSTKEESELKLV